MNPTTKIEGSYCDHLIHFWSKLTNFGFRMQELNGLTLLKSPSKMYWSHYAWGTFTEENALKLKRFAANLPFACFLSPENHNSQQILTCAGYKNEGNFPELHYHMAQQDISSGYHLQRVKTNQEFKYWLESVSTVYDIAYDDLNSFFNPVFQLNDLQYQFYLICDRLKILGTVLIYYQFGSVSLFCLSSLEIKNFYKVGKSVLHHINSDKMQFGTKLIYVQTSRDLADRFYFPFGFKKNRDIYVFRSVAIK